MPHKFHYGGQAVMEGVMMRGQQATVTVVRRPNGELASEVKAVPAISGWLRQSPFIRGFIVLIEAMVLGIRSLLYSANVALEDEDEKISGGLVWLMVAVSLTFAVGLFFVAPLFLTKLLDAYIGSSLVFHLIEGLVRLVIFIIYLKLIGSLKDIKRTFTYHGAEHKTINAYEAGVPLEVEAVRGYSTAHLRCGTSFILTVLVIAIFVFALVGRNSLPVMVASRIVLIPAIAIIGYEATRLAAAHPENGLVRVFIAPGLWLQRLTTGEPDDSQLEVAIAALKQTLAIDDKAAEVAQAPASEASSKSSLDSP